MQSILSKVLEGTAPVPPQWQHAIKRHKIAHGKEDQESQVKNKPGPKTPAENKANEQRRLDGERNKANVLKALKNGSNTVKQIMAIVHVSDTTVLRCLNELKAEKKAEPYGKDYREVLWRAV